MAAIRGLSGIIATLKTVTRQREPLSVPVGVVPLKDVVWRSPDMTPTKAEPDLPDGTVPPIAAPYGVSGPNLPDIINLKDVVLNPSETPKPVQWRSSSQSTQTTQFAQSNKTDQRDKMAAPPRHEPVKSAPDADMLHQYKAAETQHDDLKSSLRQQLHAKIDRWLDENMANLVEDALQATPQSRTKPVDKSK